MFVLRPLEKRHGQVEEVGTGARAWVSAQASDELNRNLRTAWIRSWEGPPQLGTLHVPRPRSRFKIYPGRGPACCSCSCSLVSFVVDARAGGSLARVTPFLCQTKLSNTNGSLQICYQVYFYNICKFYILNYFKDIFLTFFFLLKF